MVCRLFNTIVPCSTLGSYPLNTTSIVKGWFNEVLEKNIWLSFVYRMVPNTVMLLMMAFLRHAVDIMYRVVCHVVWDFIQWVIEAWYFNCCLPRIALMLLPHLLRFSNLNWEFIKNIDIFVFSLVACRLLLLLVSSCCLEYNIFAPKGDPLLLTLILIVSRLILCWIPSLMVQLRMIRCKSFNLSILSSFSFLDAREAKVF